MKKFEAEAMAIESSRLIIEYIRQILSDFEKVDGIMNFTTSKIEKENMCVLDIYVPQKDFEKHLNLKITSDHYLVLYERLLNDLLDEFLEDESMGVTKYYSIKSMQHNFTGMNAVNLIGSKIRINLNASGPDFMNLISKYNERYNEFIDRINREQHTISKTK